MKQFEPRVGLLDLHLITIDQISLEIFNFRVMPLYNLYWELSDSELV
jgi:hypothetical protein